MAVDWTDYADLLNELGSADASWARASNYDDFRAKLDADHAGLGPDGEHVPKGYESLLAGLMEENSGDREKAYRVFRIIALAYQDPDDPGFVLSADFGDNPVRLPAGQLYTADPDDKEAWRLIQSERDEEFDYSQDHFDSETGRWRHKAGDGEFEYYHQNDDVWERQHDGRWHRLHSDGVGWVPYEHATGLWHDPWAAELREHSQVGMRDDEETGLKFNAAGNWYLPDGETMVHADPAGTGHFYDAAGNWYEHGELWIPPAGEAAGTGLTVAEKQVVQPDGPIAQDAELDEETAGLIEEIVAAAMNELPAIYEELLSRGFSPDAASAAVESLRGDAGLQVALDVLTSGE
jgi:hypothetical protein